MNSDTTDCVIYRAY